MYNRVRKIDEFVPNVLLLLMRIPMCPAQCLAQRPVTTVIRSLALYAVEAFGTARYLRLSTRTIVRSVINSRKRSKYFDF